MTTRKNYAEKGHFLWTKSHFQQTALDLLATFHSINQTITFHIRSPHIFLSNWMREQIPFFSAACQKVAKALSEKSESLHKKRRSHLIRRRSDNSYSSKRKLITQRSSHKKTISAFPLMHRAWVTLCQSKRELFNHQSWDNRESLAKKRTQPRFHCTRSQHKYHHEYWIWSCEFILQTQSIQTLIRSPHFLILSMK